VADEKREGGENEKLDMRMTRTFPYSIGKSLCAVVPAAVLTAGIFVAVTDAAGQTADSAGPAVARLDVRLSELEQELRATTGRIEEMNFRLRQLDERLDKLVADVDYRLTRQGAATGPAPPGSQGAASPSVSPAEPGAAGDRAPMVLGRMPKSEMEARRGELSTSERPPSAEKAAEPDDVLPEGTPREQYAYGFGLMRKANYDEAETAFKEFLAAHPDDPLADNARYWLGETYYVRGDFARAAETFLEGYQRNKAGPKAPDTLLKLGMSLSALGKNKEACATYGELTRTLPDAPATIKGKADKERRRLGCS
jgi:tol-pal system protein YbgF